jgi:hypothetical protein
MCTSLAEQKGFRRSQDSEIGALIPRSATILTAYGSEAIIKVPNDLYHSHAVTPKQEEN